MRFVSIDLETTGLDPTFHEMCEFGWATHEYSDSFFVPIDVRKADPVAMEINGYLKRRKESNTVTHGDAIQRITTLFDPAMSEEETMIVCSPSFFDMGFLTAYWYKHTHVRPPWGHRNILDIKSFAAGLGYDWRGKNSEIGDKLGISDTSNHTAAQDAKYQLEIFDALKDMRFAGLTVDGKEEE
jgi:DNA polymerase III alpha subunit (gram-positive type)